eukprot:jgi/Mesvir1/28749/Mv19717-RA.1
MCALCRSIAGEDALSAVDLGATLRLHNTEQMVSVTLPGSDQKVLVTRAGELDPTHYLDPRTKKVLQVDHSTLATSSVRAATAEELPPRDSEEYRVSLEAALLDRLRRRYPGGLASIYASASPPVGSILLVACISNATHNRASFWAGSWRSVWKVDIDLHGSEALVMGEIKAQVHYCEEGNVQLNSDFKTNKTVPCKNAAQGGAAIADAIIAGEASYAASLEVSYEELSDNVFKDLRRKLPVTRTSFPWASHAASLATELQKNVARP